MSDLPRRRDAAQPDPKRRTDDHDIQHAAKRLLNPNSGDVETARQMGSGDDGDSQTIPAGDLNRGEVANAREVAQDPVDHGASEVGAPWDRVGEGARRMPRQRP